MKRKKTKNIERAALMAMRLVICRLAILNSEEANAQNAAGCRHVRSKGIFWGVMEPLKRRKIRLGALEVDKSRNEGEKLQGANPRVAIRGLVRIRCSSFLAWN
jgi:hypothetical protein